VSRPRERWGWKRREDPASSYIVAGADVASVADSVCAGAVVVLSFWLVENSASLDDERCFRLLAVALPSAAAEVGVLVCFIVVY